MSKNTAHMNELLKAITDLLKAFTGSSGLACIAICIKVPNKFILTYIKKKKS